MDGKLDGMAFFIGSTAHGFVIEDKDKMMENVKPNSIYFTDRKELTSEPYDDYNKPTRTLCGGHDLDYEDLGDQTYEFPFCGAMMWYGKRSDKQGPNLAYVTSINSIVGMYTFPLHGQNYYLLGSLLPEESTRPKFAQLYILDIKNEIQNRIDVVRSGNQSNDLDPHIVASLKDMIDGNNGVRDIVVETRSNKLQRISELHPHYLPLQYPLLFPYGEDDYPDDISLRESSLADNRKRRKDGIRVDMYKGIEDKIFKEDTEGKSIGQHIIISGSFTAGPRYMFNNFVDALQIYNWIGFRTLFIGNPRWPEIQRTFALLNFRKRDLPHAHILLWLHNDDNAKTPEKIDRIICAEIPKEEIDRNMYQLVEKYMIHGPYGQKNLKSLCMKDRVCTKRFTKPFVQQTKLDANGYTVYRRWEDGRTVMKKKTTLDNEFVVPYNRSHDRVMAAFYETRNTDCGAEIRGEIKMYYDCRYLPACEAMWRLFNFDIHYRDPYGLENYGDFPQQFVYKEDSRTWAPRKKRFSIGRIVNVPPRKGEDYYLRLLLKIQSSCTCYEDIRKVAGYVYPKFQDACYVLGLLDDKEYIDAIREVNAWASRDYIRRLFAVMLLSNSLSQPEHVWRSCWSDLAEGIAYKQQRLHNNPDLSISDESLMNCTLTDIEKILQSNGNSLRNYAPMPFPTEFAMEDTVDKSSGGKVVVLGGDFSQILPAVLKASRHDIVHAMVNSSLLWNFCLVLKLSKNMRLQSCYSPPNVDEVREFGDWILKIPDDMLIGASEDPFRDLLSFVYPDLLSEEKLYMSSDSMYRDEQTTEDNEEIYSTEFLNTIRCSGVSSHVLKFKVGAPIMLIRNIDQARELVKSTGGIKIFIKWNSGELTNVTRNVVYKEVVIEFEEIQKSSLRHLRHHLRLQDRHLHLDLDRHHLRLQGCDTRFRSEAK
ncbi:PREDICTED: uncharacterized protein LOC105976799 [Erythranthe guttata]|uniref:uncharacterized protein LOC105976799 n=1 Tax=Erythranthe guttata TaxID=4155 RepID=UPI00064D903B|nr:PREDICTED: uncharacterized protein LOC105976799 [Erythranthe guttata]|eukprot:XP_012857514.1 PREDICTED: uncharacterized protein LOC105976799 [Erythranthe guttata]